MTGFVNYSMGPVTLVTKSQLKIVVETGASQYSDRWGIAVNINENLSVSYGEAETEFAKPVSCTRN